MTILTSIATFLYLFVTIRMFYAKYLKNQHSSDQKPTNADFLIY